MSSGFWIPVEAFWLAGGWPPVTYTDTPTGGLVLGGAPADARVDDDTRSAGLLLTGAVTESRIAADAPSGGLILGGTRAEARVGDDTRTAGLLLGGTVAESRAAADAPAGGIRLAGGDADARAEADTGSGGLRLAGTVVEARAGSDAPVGGLVLGGVETDSTVPILPPPVEGGLQTLVAMLMRRPPWTPFREPPATFPVVVHDSAPAGGIRFGGRAGEQHYTAPPARALATSADLDEWRAELEELLALEVV